MGKPIQPPDNAGGPCRFVTEFRHHLTGKIMRAADYGIKAWPIRRGKK